MSEFPPNSFASNDEPDPAEEKVVEQVTETVGKKRKKPLSKRFTGMFFSGDAKSAGRYVITDVLIPSAKDMIVEVAQGFVEKVVNGETRGRRRGSTPPQAGPAGYFNYNRYSMQQGGAQAPPNISRRARETHNFDEIVLGSRAEAEMVIEQLFELISRWEQANVSDLYTLVGLPSTHVDKKWGWTDFRGSSVSKLRDGGYLLNLPDPRPL